MEKRKRKQKREESTLSVRWWFIYVFMVLCLMILPLMAQIGLGWYGVFAGLFSALFYTILIYWVLKSRQN